MTEERQSDFDAVDDFLNEELLNKREIIIFKDIDDAVAERVVKQLLHMSKKNEPIRIYIHSNGGDFEAAMSIIDTMNILKPGIIIETVAYKAISAAAFILAMGTKEHRYVFPSSVVMLHKVTMEQADDNVDNQTVCIEFCKKQSAAAYSMIAKACGKTVEKFVKDIGNDLWFNANEAKKYKVVDKIITSKEFNIHD